MKKILVCGSNGMLGGTLLRQLGPKAAIAAARIDPARDFEFCHVSLNNELNSSIDWRQIKAVVNVAGLVKGNKDKLYEANVTFPLQMAMAARSAGVRQFIHVSSFAVYGNVSYIDDNTIEYPNTYYGKTKLEADRRLLLLQNHNFHVAVLRLPFLFNTVRVSHLNNLIKVIKFLNWLPLNSNPTLRSVMTYSDAAKVLKYICDNDLFGVLHASSPTPFSYHLLNQLITEEIGKPLRFTIIPDLIIDLMRFFKLPLVARAFDSSLLNSNINLSFSVNGIQDIQNTLRTILISKLSN